jgi:hypothetical protein
MPTKLTGQLVLSDKLSSSAQSAFVLDELKTGTLISLAQLCDDDCIAIFTKYDVQIRKNDEIIIKGNRMPNGLWSLPTTNIAPSHQANGILRTDKPKQELATYLHATLGSPVPSTLLRAIRRGHLTTFPGLTTNLISKHLPKSVATSLGHQDQEAKHLRSTQLPLPNITSPDVFDSDLSPPFDEDGSHQISIMLFDKQELLKSYSDQTGRFPIPSSRGNHYMFVLYHHPTNTIHAEAIPNRQAASIRKAWEKTHKTLLRQGHPPNLHILDNECSQELKDAFTKYNIAFQRVPPKEHRSNAAERAIRTLKNHFITILCTLDSSYPMSEWDLLLPQTILTLNLLRSSRIHPSLSAHASLYGSYDFNRCPMAPPGTKIVAHVAADSRTTFGEHGKVGWYIGPSLEHYRCYKCYFPDTMKERDVLTVDFFPEKIPFPTFTQEDYLRQTAEDMLHLLTPPAASTTPTPLTFGPPILNAFAKVADILGRALAPLPTAPLQPSVESIPPVSFPLTPIRLPPPRVSVTPASIVTPPRVPIVVPVSTPVPPISAAKSRQKKRSSSSPTSNFRRSSPRFSRLHPQHPTPRYHRRQRMQLAQSMQHDPSIAGKMINPTTGRAETIDSLLHGPDSDIWTKSLTNEWGRCAQGISKSRPATEKIVGNNTIFFIPPKKVPAGRKVTYSTFVCTMRPGKAEPCRIRMTVGGDKLDAYQDVRSPAVGITDTKLHLNSTISDAKHGARYCTGDLKDFFLVSEMKIFQYMRVHRRYVPREVIDEYGLTDDYFDSKGYVYLEIRKGMYGLKEAAILAYDQLKAHLAPHGYAPVRFTPGLWKHNKRQTTFTLAVDDFGIKYFSKADADHLFSALEQKYALTKDWTGTNYLGFTLDWHYDAGYVDLSMPHYVPKALHKFNHIKPKSAQHAPHRWSQPAYGQKVQYANTDTSPQLDKIGTQRVQAVSGTFLYYGRAIDSTILPALNEISNNQARPTLATSNACDHLLDYLATHPTAIIRYYASDMILSVVADAAYLVLPKARSRCAGIYILSNASTTNPPRPTPNGAVHVLCKTLRGVPASAAEAETGGLFLNAQEAIPIITALEEMGHKQPPNGTPLETDNSTAHDILKAQVRMKRSKAFDMRYHWLKDRIRQNQFNLYWAPGKLNRADYFSKHHPPSHHRLMRYRYLQRPQANMLTTHMRGCVPPSGTRGGPSESSDLRPMLRSSDSSDHHLSH